MINERKRIYKYTENNSEVEIEFDLVALECDAYNTGWKSSHLFPHEVIQAAKDLNTNSVRYSLSICIFPMVAICGFALTFATHPYLSIIVLPYSLSCLF